MYDRKLARIVIPIAICLIVTSAFADQDEIPRAVVEDGRHAYQSICASCHGESGKGDGPLAAELTAKPIDLTQIAREHAGQFPFWYVFKTIDGRLIPRFHGGPEMPVWGARSESIYGAGPTREWMLAVTFYIESIQEK